MNVLHHMQKQLTDNTRTDTLGVTMCLFRGYRWIQRGVCIGSCKQQQSLLNRGTYGRASKAWPAVLETRSDLNIKESWERDTSPSEAFEFLFAYFSWLLCLSSSRLITSDLLFPPSLWSPSTVHRSGSRAALAHAWPQHQSTLLRNLWVFDHALPNLLFLPVRVHPVHFISVAFTLGREETY